MDFLEFTTENELDFENGFLPTLDTQMKVEDDGSVTYKFFSKPMNNNLVIENGTALPRNIIFGSLRQEIVRRMQNTSMNVDKDTKVSLIEEMIQLMINSKHKFAFIKSVVLQGLSKFSHMVYRATLPVTHCEYMPLHRPYHHRRNERLLIKYANRMLWFTQNDLGDPYKKKWKSKIKFRWSKKYTILKKIRKIAKLQNCN